MVQRKKRLSIAYLDLDDIRNPLLNAGQARATYEVASRLATRGYDITVYCSRYPGSRDRREKGITYKHIAVGTSSIKLNNLLYILLLPFYVHKIKADLILESFVAPISTTMAPLFTKIPVIGIPSMFNAKEFTQKYHFPFHLIEKMGIKFYKYLLPYSDIDSTKAKKLNPNITYKIVPQGVGEEYFAIKQQKPEYILFLSRFDVAQKGLDLLLKAYAKVAHKIGYPLVLAGHGPDIEKVQTLIGELGLNKKVKLIGPTYGKKKFDVMAKALYVTFPSRHDEMCLWSLEALAGGLPLIGFDLPESAWMSNEVSLKAKRYSIDDYARMLMKAAQPERIASMRKESRTFAKQFTWENVINEYESFMQEVIEKEANLISQSIFSRLLTKLVFWRDAEVSISK